MRKHIKNIYIIAVVLSGMLAMSACKKPSAFKYPDQASSYSILYDDVNYTYFIYAINKAGLTATLQGGDKNTIFAPSNAAFINSGYTLAVLQNMSVADVTALVKYNMVAGAVDVKTTSTSQSLTNLAGKKITVQQVAGHLYVDGGDITSPSLSATNGYVNYINKVLTVKATLLDVINNYNNTTANSQLTFLAAAIARASTGSTDFTSLLTGSTPYTFFAPNNGAFIAAGYANLAAVQNAAPDVLGNILKYHLIAGNNLLTAYDSVAVNSYAGTPIYFSKDYQVRTSYWFVNGIGCGNNFPSNMLAANGSMNIISAVMTPPLTVNTLAYINSNSTLTMFYALIQRASQSGTDFASMLSSATSTYTVYAVNNTGLTAAGFANAAAVTAADPATLADILRLHMVQKRINNVSITTGGTVLSTLPNAGTANPVTYDPLTLTNANPFTVKGPGNAAAIAYVTSSVVTTNGLVNVIGTKLLP